MSLSSCIDGSTYALPYKDVDSDILYTKIDNASMLTEATDISYHSLNDHIIIEKHDLDVLKTMPNELLVERENKCQNCIRAHAASIVKCLNVRGSCYACNKKKMLLYGYCPDFESVNVLEVEAAANGVD